MNAHEHLRSLPVTMFRTGVMLLAATTLFATDGISVTGHWSGSSYAVTYYTLSRFAMQTDHITTQKVLFAAGSGRGGCYPAIDPSGTHVAFCRFGDGAWHLSVMDIDSGEQGGVHDLTTLAGRTQLAWSSDGGVYYLKNGGAELWRIDVADPKRNAMVHRFPVPLAVFRMSHDAGRLHTFNADDDLDERLWWQRNSAGAYAVAPQQPGAGGCSPGIAPSGSYLLHYTDAGHVVHIMTAWDFQNSPPMIHDQTLNTWAIVNQGETPMVCGGSPRPLGFGGGTLGHHWSVNSDRWAIANMGTDSRFFNCGSNQILFNWIDKKAVNVTRGYRACKEAPDVPNCDIGTGDIPGGTSDKHAEPGSFWVSTLLEVNTDLRCYLEKREQWRTHWRTVLAGGASMRPSCATSAPGAVRPRRGSSGRLPADRMGLCDLRGRALSRAKRGIAVAHDKARGRAGVVCMDLFTTGTSRRPR